MAEKTATAFVPKLRFPEFADGADWEAKPLHKLAVRRTQRNFVGSKLRTLTNSAEFGVVDQRDYFEKDISTNTENYFVVETGDFVYNSRISSIAPVGPISKNRLSNGVMSPLYSVFRFHSDENDFFSHFFASTHWHKYLRIVSNSGARHDRMAISNDDLMAMPIPLPPTPAEQQKIAECLGSLDDLIAAESRKLEALRRHKKGLMQQLFPQPGETVPRVRFSEFQNAGEWEKFQLDQLVDIASGLVDPTKKPYCDLPHVGGENIESESGQIRNVKTAKQLALSSGKYAFDERDVLYSKIRPALNKVALPSFSGICSADIYPIRPKSNKVIRIYLAFLLQSDKFFEHAVKSSDRSKIPKINRDALLSYVAEIPRPDEQKRIADLLTSLVSMIGVQEQKCEGLTNYKHGLLQQLFPSLEGNM